MNNQSDENNAVANEFLPNQRRQLEEYMIQSEKRAAELLNKRYSLNEILAEACRKKLNYKKDMEVPESTLDTCRQYFREFCLLMELPIDQLRDNNRYFFTARNKDFLVNVLSNFTEPTMRKIRNGEIGAEEFETFLEIIQGAQDILKDAHLPRDEFVENMNNLYKRVGLFETIRDATLYEIRSILAFNGAILSSDDKMECLEWIYNLCKNVVKTVVAEMEDIRRMQIQNFAEEIATGSFSDQTSVMIRSMLVQQRLDEDIKYRELLKKIQNIEYPKGKKGSRNLAKQNEDCRPLKEQLINREKEIREEVFDKIEPNVNYLLNIQEYIEENRIMFAVNKMSLSEEVLRQAIINKREEIVNLLTASYDLESTENT